MLSFVPVSGCCKILKKINRGCYLKDTIWATYLLKQNGYKVDWHLMPDLPGSSYEKDLKMINDIFGVKIFRKISLVDFSE